MEQEHSNVHLFHSPEKSSESHCKVRFEQSMIHGCRVNRMRVASPFGIDGLGNKSGEYISIDTGELYGPVPGLAIGNCLAEILEPILKPFWGQKLCICGLGNPDYICDALGPQVLKRLPATQLEQADLCNEGRFSKLILLSPGILTATNIPTMELISKEVAAIEADCLLLVDCILVDELGELGNNIVISTTGGTELHGGRHYVDWDVLDLPVISIGVPTMLNLARSPDPDSKLLTSHRIQEVIDTAAALIAYGLVKMAYPSLTDEICIDAVESRPSPFTWQ